MAGFHDIIGHDKVKDHLRKAIEYHKVSHAYILSGEEGMGKKTLADAFAMTLLCERSDKEPCLQCHACKQMMSGNHPDVIRVTHEKPGSIGVDDIRTQINDTIYIKPYSSSYKIYLVDEAEKMTPQAQNALLKTIEEPPAYAVIMLMTTNQELFLPTILSRCIQLKLRPLKDTQVSDYLKETMGIPEEKADVFAAFARGNLGKAIHLASSEEFGLLYRQILNLLKNLKEMDISMLLDSIRKLQEDQLDLRECLDFMQLWYRDILMFKVTKDINTLVFKDEYAKVSSLCQKSSYEGLELILEAIEKAKTRLDANVNADLALELMLLTMKEN
ncbi:MAG: DNA polymerase III subunit delta' [Clostridium sp.]|nr:DNA polymerase III subunit delta' [Clostridiaceae bacterium]MDD6074152.1 DNA polymerase III subunit delta' [Clostridium sp.]MDY5483043.1 DNA polymerase III subunit delta' [Clostridium sp.]